MSFFENTRKPVGLGGKIMVAMMNLGTACGAVGTSIFEACAGCQGAGLRLRRRSEHQKTAEKMPAGHREGHRLFAVSVENRKRSTRAAISGGRCTVLQAAWRI